MAEETIDERRVFVGPDGETEYFIAPPNAEDIRGADWQYSKVYTTSLVEGITTSAEMMDILMRRGIIGPEFEQRAQELTDNLNKAILELESATTPEEKQELAVVVANTREELFQWNQRLNGPMSNTCEQLADDARLEYLTSCMVQDKDGKSIWDSYDEYLTEKEQGLATRARFEVMLYLQGLSSDFLEKTPEAMAMKEAQQEVLEEANKAIKLAEALEEEEAKKSPKKSAKKKTTAKKSKSSSKKKATAKK